MNWRMSKLPLPIQLLAVAAAYFATARLGLLLAIPPGYATPIWAPSGVALAAVLLLGPRASWGVLAGSFAANVMTSSGGVGIAAAIASGAALQALAGGWTVRRFAGYPNAMSEPGSVVRFLALGGPASCLVNATVSVTVLCAAGVVPWADWDVHWTTWWVGDSIGVMVVAPVVLIFFAEPRANWSRRRLTVALPMSFVFAAFVAVFVLTSRNEQARLEGRLHDESDDIQRSLEKRVDACNEVLQAIASFHASSNRVDRDEFRTFVGRYLKLHPGVQAISLVPRVGAEERAAHEEAVRAEGYPGYAIIERDRFGDIVPAAPRDEYFPIHYIEPWKGNERALGFDVASDPLRRSALVLAAHRKAIAASPPIRLVQDRRGPAGVFLAVPVGTGYATAVFQVGTLLESALVGVRREGLRFSLYDGEALYSEPESVDDVLAWTRSLPVGGRRWELRFSASRSYLLSHPAWEAWTVLVGGMIFTSLLGAFLLVVTGRSIAIEGIVTARTAELHASEERFRAIAETANDAIITADVDGLITQWNRGAQDLFGYGFAEVSGKPLTILMPERLQESHRQGFQRFRRTGERRILGRTVELVGRRKDGSEFPCELSIATWEAGSARYFTGFLRDITERRRLNEDLSKSRVKAEEASRAKSEFLANMSHEIRTPMNGILGMTDLALGTDLTPVQREYLGLVRSSAESLLYVINDILDFSKIEARKMTLEETEFDLREVLESATKTVALRAHEKGLDLACRVPLSLPDRLVGDPARLRQVVLNLLSNAVKFTAAGEVVLSVAREPESGLVLKFSVRDTGPGIPPDKLDMIFEAFVQADSSTTRNFGGTGLGLPISRQLATLMGGRLWVESRVGSGSTFHFTGRFKPAAGPALPQPSHSDLRGLVVAAVDDNETNRIILRELLNAWAMRSDVFARGSALLDALDRAAMAGEPYPLVILDDRMPEMSGLEVASRIRAKPELAGTAIILLGSSLAPEETARRRELGLEEVLLKPVRSSDLLRAIQKAFGRSRVSSTRMPSVAAPKPRTDGLRILVAEDHPINQRLAMELLQGQGHKVTLVPDGRQAVEASGSASFDLVLMDVQMPVMDGLAATAAIRERERDGRPRLPIIALTAHALKTDRDRCLAAGMDGYLSKPIRLEELTTAVDSIRRGGRFDSTVLPAARPAANLAFDPVTALRQVGDDPMLLREIIGAFLEEAPRQEADLRRAVDEENAELLERTAHTLKGTCVIFAAEDARKAAHDLEMKGRAKNFEGCDPLLGNLAKAVERLRRDLELFQKRG